VREIFHHTSALSPQAHCPILHFDDSTNIGVSLLDYLEKHIDLDEIYLAVSNRHFGHLRRMVLAETIESFER
jgi:hypothetical protein